MGRQTNTAHFLPYVKQDFFSSHESEQDPLWQEERDSWEKKRRNKKKMVNMTKVHNMHI